MFTGIVERTGVVEVADGSADGLRLGVRIAPVEEFGPWRPVVLGESIAINGTCLTVVEFENPQDDDGVGRVAFDVIPESLEKTALGELRVGDGVNLERSLCVGDELGGHYVTGHIDGVGTVRARRTEGDQELFEITTPAALLRQAIPKGSVSVDGISLTVIDVDRAGGWFSFAAIPHTLERTQLDARVVGSPVHLEMDAFGKWVLHAFDSLLEEGAPAAEQIRRLVAGTGRLEEGE